VVERSSEIMHSGTLAQLQRLTSCDSAPYRLNMVACACLHRLISMVNTAFTVNGEGRESGARWRQHEQEREQEREDLTR
jgi:hypothetical protein